MGPGDVDSVLRVVTEDEAVVEMFLEKDAWETGRTSSTVVLGVYETLRSRLSRSLFSSSIFC
jgi:hypothetical protein